MNAAEKTCPFCGESIKAVAIRCRFCHADLTGTASAPAVASLAAFSSAVPVSAPSPPATLESWQVLDLLSHLVDKNLVVYEEDENGKGRYRLMETVRQYTRDRLLESSAGQASRVRHRDHFLALAEEASKELRGPEQAQWLNRLETEHDNLRAALEWCLDDEEEQGAEAGLRMTGALWRFWETRGYFSEGRERYAAALSHPRAQGRTKERAGALSGAGNLARIQGDYVFARSLLEESLALQRELGDKQGVALSFSSLGLVATEQGDYASARSLFEESLATMRELGDKQSIAFLLNGLGAVTYSQGDNASARTFLEEGLALQRQLGDKRVMAASLGNLGLVATEQGDTASARMLFEESLALHREIGDKQGIAMSLANRGPLACQEQDYAVSRSCLAECLTLCRAMGEKRVSAYALEGFGALATAQKQPHRAVSLYGAADALRAAFGMPLSPNEREAVDRDLAALRATLGEQAFDGMWAAARAMTWEQAIAYALEENAP